MNLSRLRILVLLVVVLLFPALALGEKMADLVEREGLYYKKFSDVPFSGEVTEDRFLFPTQGSFKNGERDGLWVRSWFNRKLKEKGTYKKGVEDGPWVSYDNKGQLNEKGTYKNGKKDGPWVGYYTNGQLKEKGTYKNGKKDGPWVTYYADGQLKGKGTYKNGVKVSPLNVR